MTSTWDIIAEQCVQPVLTKCANLDLQLWTHARVGRHCVYSVCLQYSGLVLVAWWYPPGALANCAVNPPSSFLSLELILCYVRMCLLFFTGYTIFRGCNSQKHDFKHNPKVSRLFFFYLVLTYVGAHMGQTPGDDCWKAACEWLVGSCKTHKLHGFGPPSFLGKLLTLSRGYLAWDGLQHPVSLPFCTAMGLSDLSDVTPCASRGAR